MGKESTLARVIQTLLIGIRQNTILEAERSTIEFEKLVRTLRDSGMSNAEIKKLLLQDFIDKNPRLFGAYKNAIKEELAGAIHQADSLGAVDLLDEGEKMKWTTTTEHGRTCEDCEARAGQVKPLSFWRLIGLPKSGFSRCGRRCLCVLTPVKDEAPDRMEIHVP